jgi:hypothetical protein
MNYFFIACFVSFVTTVLFIFFLRISGKGKGLTKAVANEWIKRGKSFDAYKSIMQAETMFIITSEQSHELLAELDLMK